MISAAPPVAACLRELPPAPLAALPVPVALDAGCALVVMASDRSVRLRPRPRISLPPGAQTASGSSVTWRGGHVVWLRGGRVLWRSQARFHAGRHHGVFTTISAASSTGRNLAFVVSRWAGRDHPLLFVSDRAGREHLVSRAATPLGWTPRGLVAARVSARRVVLGVWHSDGRRAAAPLTVNTRTWAWDWSTDRLYAVTGGRIVLSDGASVIPLARLSALGLEPRSRITLTALGHGLIELASSSTLIVLDSAGHTRVHASLPAGWRLDGTITAAGDGTVAFEAIPLTPRASRTFRLYVAGPGGQPRLLDHYTVPPACIPNALALRGSGLLLTATGLARLYDIHGSRPPVDLEPAVAWLRARHRTGQPRLL
jgi:hypothetical protein